MSLPDINELSERERDILRLVATGAGNKQIAAQLFISTNTVKVHLRNIFAKIGAASRTEAAMTAVRLGLVQSTAVGSVADLVPADASEFPADDATLRHLESAPGNRVAAEGEDQPATDQTLVEPLPRRSSRRQVWLMRIGLLAVLAVLAVFGLLLVRSQTTRPPTSLTAAPRITPLPRWQARTGMPAARTGLAVVAFDDRLYAIGGESAAGVTGILERYDPAANTWETLAEKPLPAADIQAAAIGGKIYVPGGRTASGEVTKSLEIYDPGMNRWEQGVDLPTALSAYALAAFEGRLYLFGGWDGAQFASLVYQFDPRSGSWATLTPLPARRGFAGATLAGGKIFVVGGRDEQQALADVEVYSPAREGLENPWRRAASMPAGRYGMGISSVADIIYVVCGQGPEDGPQPSLAYFPQTNVWQSFETPPINLGRGLGLAASGEYLFAVGGISDSVPRGDILAYQVVYTVGIPVIIK